MKTTASIAAFAAAAAAQQFVVYSEANSDYSQRADPIITPGELSGHVHDFLGAGAMAPELSYDALQDTDCTTVGSASGMGLESDKSVYWHPALYAKKNDGSYTKVKTTSHKMYYRKIADNTEEFPAGFRMVAGDPFLREANTNMTGITQWTCFGPDVSGEDGGFPTITSACNSYPGFMGKIHFPHCWNGELESADNSHVSYPVGNPQDGECPSSHPRALPHIFMEDTFDMTDATLAEIDPSTLTLAQGDSTGYGWHADFFNGWVSGDIMDLFNNCEQGEYGNHDVGECSTVKLSDKSRADCKLKNYFQEAVDAPGKALIGCNPISLLNPAPKNLIAKLGLATTSCGGGNAADESDNDMPSYEAPSSSASISSIPAVSSTSAAVSSTVAAAPSTTFAISTTAAAAQPEQSYGGWPEEDEDDDEYEWVTEWVTETAVAQVTAYAKRDSHRHQHMNAHRRRHF